MWNYIPQHIQKKAVDEMGETLEAAAEAVWQYNKGIVECYLRYRSGSKTADCP